MNRDAFLAPVRDAAAAGRTYRVHTRPFDESVGYCGVSQDLVERFAAEAAAVGGQVRVVSGDDGAREAIAATLAEIRPRSALVWKHALLDRLGVAALLAQAGAEALDVEVLAALPAEERRARMLAADIGITSATHAVAETGSLVMAAERGRERAASLLPPLHLAVIERSQILPDLFDIFDALAARGLDRPLSNVTFITGPSKTGDLEMRLITGVHGPGRWCVIVIG